MEIAAATVPSALAAGVNPYIGRVYRVLFVVLAGVALVAAAAYFWLPPGCDGPVDAADGLVWLLCGWFEWRRPVALVLPIFGLSNGLTLGLLARSGPVAFLCAAILVLTAFGALTVYVHFTRRDFKFLRPFLFASFFVLVIGGLLAPFYHTHLAQVVAAAFGTLVFLCWILYDTSEVIDRADEDGSPWVAAFELLLDIVALQTWLFGLFRESEASED